MEPADTIVDTTKKDGADSMSPASSGSACGLCGSTSLTNLGGTVICNGCGAHWWKRWYTRKEWEEWINEPTENNITATEEGRG